MAIFSLSDAEPTVLAATLETAPGLRLLRASTATRVPGPRTDLHYPDGSGGCSLHEQIGDHAQLAQGAGGRESSRDGRTGAAGVGSVYEWGPVGMSEERASGGCYTGLE